MFIYFNKKNRAKVAAIILGSGLILAVLFVPYAEMSEIVGLRLYREVLPNVPKLETYLLPHESSLPWNFLFEHSKTLHTKWWEMYLFPGIIIFGTLAFSVIYLGYIYLRKIEISTWIKALLVTVLILTVLHIRIGEQGTLYALIFKLPGINSMRVLNRFMHVELFLLLLILGYFIRQLNTQRLVIIFTLLVIDNSFDAEKVVRESKNELIARKEQLMAEIKKHNPSNQTIVALVDTQDPAYISHIDMMLAAQALHLRTINGYSSYCADAYGTYFLNCSSVGLNQWIQNQNIDKKNILIISPANR
ncbi:MAG: hypothetical protein ACRCYO_20045 [Bacteroidia bacterium]